MSSVVQLLRPHLQGMQAYESARRSMSGGNIWLNANENPYSSNWNVSTENLNRYPNFQSSDLNRAYAQYAGVNPDQVLSHRGSDEAIDILIRAFCEPGQDKVMICPPTYGMYAISAKLNNNSVVSVPLLQDGKENGAWQLDIDEVKANLERVKIVFLCTPSNPLGNLIEESDLNAVLEASQGKCIVVVDEAYIEYSESTSATQLLEQYSNLVITRTLSKAFGLAGIRVGFTLANPEIIAALTPVLAPYPLPDLSIQVAQQALTADALIQTRQNIIEAQGERERLSKQLAIFSWVKLIFPSVTNFVLFQVENAEQVMSYLQAKGILIRNQSSQVNLSNCLRITVGSPAENDAVIEALSQFPGDTQ
ncbi:MULTISPECIES: histidinol-phosphate transaminase [Gammaproteobacteria]|uniref:histidinol-phosphate transaminase n=1 Tax=Gammaproteobacteria TaxID=1236 RepID=UPI000DD0B940|nr:MULTISPECIES: histidinol-phosphate transaminase [Gammaproteobacteria]RTE87616.1 histidinol-phosphate transaminase [Aliidiomarina sp. B3213]TCZ92599.1 histidinol-phosphate transaminase [Lysobacter sp. N42]